jgi:relaxase-like protein
MRATAAQSQLVQKPVYQIVLSFAPEDRVDRGLMERVADRVLGRLGLGEHEAILVAHSDRPHPHVHIVVNRVHPETGRVWSTWQDWRRVRHVVSEEERALGLRQVSSRLVQVDLLAQDLRAYERLVELTREQYRATTEMAAARARATYLADTAEDAHAAASRCMAALGQVYRDPDAASDRYRIWAGRDGVALVTQRMRERPEEFGALVTREGRGALGLWRTETDGQARDAAPAAAAAARASIEAAQQWQRAADAEATRLEQAFEEVLSRMYEDPAAARALFERIAAEHGLDHAVAALRERSAVLGAVHSPVRQEGHALEETLAQAVTCGTDAVQARTLTSTVDPRVQETGRTAAPVPHGALGRATARVNAIGVELRALPNRAALERRIGSALIQLWPREVRILRTVVTAPQFAIAMQLRAVALDVALDRDADRDD